MRVHRSWLAGVAVLTVALAAASPIFANMRATIEGSKQGRFANEVADGSKTSGLVLTGYGHKVESPRDPATGSVTGARRHSPVVLTRPVGPASPQLFQALCTNEVLSAVQIEVSAPGSTTVAYRIKLVNATVSNIEQFTDDAGRLMEKVSFAYQRIEVEHPGSKTMAVDDWFQKG